MSPLTWAVVLLAGVTCVSTLGEETTLVRYSSLAQVEDRVGVAWLQQCVASILTSYHVMTAASCLPDNGRDISTRRIRAGAAERGTGGEVVEIEQIRFHPSFGTLGADGDLAVLRLVSGLTFGPQLSQAVILGQGIDLPTNLRLTLASWGTTTEGGLIGNNNLYELPLYVVDGDRCMEQYLAASPSHIVTENMICSGLTYNSGRDLDSRDTGAPLIYEGVTVALLSFGVSRGNDEYPLVSTAVGPYSDWIVETAARF